MTTTWRELIDVARKRAEDTSEVVHCTLTDQQLDVEFDDSYGGHEGAPFTLWTKERVYFPIVYDGSEWAGSAPRNPCEESVEHQGGE